MNAPALNPAVRFGAALILAIGLVWSFDPVSAGVALVLELAAIAILRPGWGAFWRRTAILWAAAPISGLTLLLYGQPSGTHWFDAGLIHITDGSIALAGTMVLRVLSLALPAVVLFIGVDPTDFADALVQVVRLPSRFVYGALGALRLTGLFREDRRMLELARRARGVERRGLTRVLGGVQAMFLLSVRRGSALATAMEARGFGGPTPRTSARRSLLGWPDVVLVAIACAIPACAVTAAVLAGTWHPIVG